VSICLLNPAVFLELLKAIIKDSVLNSRGRFGIRIIPGRKTNA
jgi:hypothetical protein